MKYSSQKAPCNFGDSQVNIFTEVQWRAQTYRFNWEWEAIYPSAGSDQVSDAPHDWKYQWEEEFQGVGKERKKWIVGYGKAYRFVIGSVIDNV